MEATPSKAIGVLTSGGDAQGMNAAVRAVVRSAISRNVSVYAIWEGYQGMVDGGDRIREMKWSDVGGIMNLGGTVIGTARCAAFRTREGRLQAARHLLERGIDGLVIIGGDGSLTGADIFRREWPSLVAELVESGQVDQETVSAHANLRIVGLVGSIDNDMVGTDMTIGADTALHRIIEAIDALRSTAASHQRTFVVEVMGRNCGYLALMAAVAGGGGYVLLPENPPETDNWEQEMCDLVHAARMAGRRDSIVVVAEGAQDRYGKPITSDYVRHVLEERLGEDARVTILGHVQRGGAPSAFDRWMSTLLGHAAVEELLSPEAESEPQLIGIRYNRVTHLPLMKCVEQTQAVAKVIADHDYARAMELRGGSFTEMYNTFQAIAQSKPSVAKPEIPWRMAVMNAGALAPGMNTAVAAAMRLGLDQGYTMLAVRNGFQGLIDGQVEEFQWGLVDRWMGRGGSELGTDRKIPAGSDWYAIARNIERFNIQALLVVGGWEAYRSAYDLYMARSNFPTFKIPMICLPVSIDNNLPGSELSIGPDTALNSIVEAVDKIKRSAVAERRCFVVEVMGRYCGYLALMSGLATGAERVYIHEEGIHLSDLQADLKEMIQGFIHGKRLSLVIRNENANPLYTTAFLCALFEEEGRGYFDVRQAILGHIQRGGDPSPFDRIQATRLAARCIRFLGEELKASRDSGAFIGLKNAKVQIFDLEDMPRMIDAVNQRPKEQWWLELRPIAKLMA